jgi:hypothetical protein
MPSKNLPCGCKIDWGEIGTKLFLCGIHQFQYNLWDGSEEEFVKMVATPTSHAEMDLDNGLDSGVISESK